MQENLIVSINKLRDILQENVTYYNAKNSVVVYPFTTTTTTTATTTSINTPFLQTRYFNKKKLEQPQTEFLPPTGAIDPPTVRKHINLVHAACYALLSVLSSVETSSITY